MKVKKVRIFKGINVKTQALKEEYRILYF